MDHCLLCISISSLSFTIIPVVSVMALIGQKCWLPRLDHRNLHQGLPGVSLPSFPYLNSRKNASRKEQGRMSCTCMPSSAKNDRSSSSLFPAAQETQASDIWEQLRHEALAQSESEPYLASYFYATILAHPSLERSLAFHLANKLANPTLLSAQLFALFWETFADDSSIQEALRADIKAFNERDPACTSYLHGMLNFKGFLACEAHRIAHRLWRQGRYALALALQNRISEVFQVDIHPGARIGKGVLLDHATGVVVGETAVIGDNVSILHHVTLGGTGNCCGDRHPKIGNGVLIGAGAILLGPIVVGDGAKVGACSLVLVDVPSYATAVGVPARILRTAPPDDKEVMPALSMDHTSLILDYII